MLEGGSEASKKAASKHGAYRRREEEEEEEEKKTPAAPQKRKEKKKSRRPLSCIVQPPSPRLPAVDRSLKNPHRSPEADSSPRGSSPRGAAPTRHAKAQDRSRPVSCFVETPQHRSPPPYSGRPQQPSPQASVRLDEQFARTAGTPDQTLPPYSAISYRSSALFGSPCQESPSLRSQTPITPEAPRRDFPYYAESSQQQPMPYYADSSQQPILYYDETPQKTTAYYGETPQQATPYYGETPQQSSPYYGETSQKSSPYYGETSQQSSPYYGDTSQQSSPYYGETPQQSSPYYGETPQQSSPYYGETPQQSSPYYTEALHQQLSCYGGTPRQSTPVMGSPGSSEPLEARRRNSNCPLSPCPYQPSTPPQAYSGGRSYDLKTYFPSAAPVRRGPHLPSRPQSACFLCEPQPCCAEGGRARRPLSQCYLPGCSLPWSGPKITRGSAAAAALQEEVLAGQSTPASPASGVEVVTLPTPPLPPPAHAVERSPIPRPRSGVSLEPERSSPPAAPAPTLQEASPATPRAAKRTLLPLPRPKSACLLSAELESESSLAPTSSPTRGGSSPAPSPPPPRFALKKYRSADCLDRVDEIESLNFSPPPAKPLSYFTDSDSQSAKTTTTVKKRKNKHDEIYTSAEMLEKLGQPRGARISSSHPAGWRPVSCFVGSADESGYLSSATLGGSGWLGGLSASTGDILEILDGDEVNAADDELSFERASSFRKAWSVCSLLRQDSIQDRSFTVMRRRRQKMKNRRQSNLRSSSTETDEGVEVKTGHSATSSLDEDREKGGEGDGEGEESSSTVAGFPLDGTLGYAPGSRGRREVRRLHSAHMKTWQIRLRRKQMLMKRRSYERLNPRMETLV